MTNRLFSLHTFLQRKRLDAILLNTSEFLSSVNLTYFSGFIGSDASVLITPTERHLFTDGRYKTQARQQAKGFLVHVVKRKIDALARSLEAMAIHRLGIEGNRVSYEFVETLARRLPSIEVVPLPRQFTENIRLCKSAEELAKIKKAAQIASEACQTVLQAGITGRTEAEVAADLERLFRILGADGIAFDTLVASGPRSALPHGKPSSRVIGPGELVVLDYGCKYEGYNSDETVACINGKPSNYQQKMCQAVYEAHERSLDSVRVGVKVRELDNVARHSIEKAGFGDNFLHGLGHGIGMEVHEPPSLSQRGRGVLKEGMVFTIEPGVYVEGLGGVRLESLVHLSGQGPEILSRMPKELILVG